LVFGFNVVVASTTSASNNELISDANLTTTCDMTCDTQLITTQLSLQFRKLDRKLERSVGHGKRQAASSEIAMVTDADKVFWLASRIVLHQVHSVWLWPAEDALVVTHSGIDREEYRDIVCGLLKVSVKPHCLTLCIPNLWMFVDVSVICLGRRYRLVFEQFSWCCL
jgi:hypothetical protein